jgi:hypothetical protein
MTDTLPKYAIQESESPENEWGDWLQELTSESLDELLQLRALARTVLAKPDEYPEMLYPVAVNLEHVLGEWSLLTNRQDPNIIKVSLPYQFYKHWATLERLAQEWKNLQSDSKKKQDTQILTMIQSTRLLIATQEMKKTLKEYQEKVRGMQNLGDESLWSERWKEIRWYLGVLAIAFLGVLAVSEGGPLSESVADRDMREGKDFPVEDSRNLYLAQHEHLLNAQRLAEFSNVLDQVYSFGEVKPATEVDFQVWGGEVHRVLMEMGIQDWDSAPYQYKVHDLPEGTAGTVERKYPNTLQLDDELLNDSKWAFYVIAHEAVHLEAEHKLVRFEAFEHFDDFTLALWSVQYREAQAELLTLEVLSRLVETGATDQIKEDARASLYLRLKSATNVAREFSEVIASGNEVNEETAWLHDAYYYSYVPMWKIQEMVHGGFYQVPVVEHGALNIIGNHLQEVPMSGFGRFLWNEGLVQTKSENNPSSHKK